jgi:hypothetical protein
MVFAAKLKLRLAAQRPSHSETQTTEESAAIVQSVEREN